MFWGLNLKSNRKYTQKVTRPFHISNIALDPTTCEGGTNQIFITHDDQKYLICTLRKDVCEQVTLDLNFAQGDDISFQSVGSGNVSLAGYLIDDDVESDDETQNEMVTNLRDALKKKLTGNLSNEMDDDDDEDDSDYEGGLGLDDDKVTDDNDDDDDDDDDDDEDLEDLEDESEEDEQVQQPKAKQQKLDKPHKQLNGVAKETVAAQKESKKSKKEKKQQQQPQQKEAGGERSLSGGVKINDIRVGNGPEAKSGKRAQVYYEGRIKANNKVFDSCKQGAGFKFRIGSGEVIKGWDIGVAGMKVGGKRRIICPPHMAYGARGSPPSIPPNSTLVFEVELKSIN